MERELCICQAVVEYVPAGDLIYNVHIGISWYAVGSSVLGAVLLAVWLQQDSLSSDLLGALIGAVSVLRLVLGMHHPNSETPSRYSFPRSLLYVTTFYNFTSSSIEF